MRHDAARAAILVFAAAGTFAGFGRISGAQESTPRPTPTRAPCARPNVPGSVVHAALLETPAMAAQQGIGGNVQVVVSLDENSRVIGTRIQSSPSAILNAAALAAARQTTYQTAIRDCRPIAGDYIFSIDFESTVTFSISASGERTVSAVGGGSVKRTADLAYVQANIETREDAAADAAAKNDAAFAALNAKLAALGVGARSIRDSEPRRLESGYVSSRYVEIAVDDVANVGRTVAAASSAASVVVIGVRFSLHDSAPAQREALSIAIKDAEQSARQAVAAQHLRLGVVRQVVVPPSDRARPPIAVVPFRLDPIVGGFTPPPVPVPDLEIRASATVTYEVKP